MSEEHLQKIAETVWEWDVRGVVVGGGGEPLCNPFIGSFIEEMKATYTQVGLITNGVLLDNCAEVKDADWVGVSVDSANPDTWTSVHGNGGDHFDDILNNMRLLIDAGVHVTYKFLIRNENINEVYDAVSAANTIGCKNVHFRPAAVPWWREDKDMYFDPDRIEHVHEQLKCAREDFPGISIVGIFDKVDADWRPVKTFEKCHGIFTTCIFMPDGRVGFCCDQRGFPPLEIGPLKNPKKLVEFWGSKEHFEMQKRVCNVDCSRCTLKVFNEFYEKAVLEDGFMLGFI
jgi:MoaA/NifB/PqqE/SkfB family radical SAM enzyme